MSGFVRVGEAGRVGKAIVAVVVLVPVCNCMLPFTLGKRMGVTVEMDGYPQPTRANAR